MTIQNFHASFNQCTRSQRGFQALCSSLSSVCLPIYHHILPTFSVSIFQEIEFVQLKCAVLQSTGTNKVNFTNSDQGPVTHHDSIQKMKERKIFRNCG